ncbi:MAG: type I secretion C-terminal target domain-containing protein, partial [Legionella sp.]|nr:type I secretion C-terminal target domain-containing protein [Legionella sp.]
SYGAEDGLVNINWTPPAFSDGQESISGISFNNIPDGSRLLINGTFITAIGDTSVTLTAAQVQQLLNGATLQLKAPEDSDVDINLNSIVTVSQSDVDGTGIVTKDITGNLHLDIRAVVEPDANLQVISQEDGSVITSLSAINGSVIDLSTGANSQAQVTFQDLDPSSVETIKVMVISGLGSQFVVVGGIYDGVGNWIVPESGLDNLQIISKHGYNGTLNITIHTQVQDMGDNNEGDVSVLATRQTSLSLTFTGSGGGPGDPITEAGVISINDTVIIGQEDIPVTFGAQLAGMLTLTGGTPDDVYALIIEGPLPEGFSLTGSGVVYDFVHDRYIISATSDGMGGLTVGQVFLETPEDYSGTLPFDVNWVATNMESGDINQGAAPVSIPVDITPIVDIPPAVTLQVVQTEGLDADKQPVGSGNEVTYPNVAYEDGLITLDLNVISADNDGSEQISSVLVKVDPAVGVITDANGVPFAVDANGFVSIPVADIDSIKLKPVNDYSGPVHVIVQVGLVDSAVDSNGNTITDTDSYTKDLTFNILPINDPVTYTNANNFVFTGNEDVSGGVAFSGLSVHTNDSDGSEKIVSLVISGVPDGFLIGSAQNMGNGEWKVTVNNSNFDLSNIKLIPPDDFSGTVNLQVTAYTKEALAALPTVAGTQAFSVVVNPVSDVVDIIGAGAASNLSGIENGSISVALNIQARDDTDTYTGTSPNVSENVPETLLLTIKGVPNTAEIELPAGVDGSLVSKIFDTNTNTWTWVFTVNESQLTNIVFLPGDSNGAIELIVQAQAVDGNAVPGPVKEIIVDVDVTAVNDAPVNIIPASFNTSEDQPIVLNGIQISDIDAREINGAMTVTLEVAHGNLTLGTSPGVTLSGNGTGLVVVTGSIDAINALLASGVGYQGALNFNGQDSLKMTTNDNGNSGGPALTAETIVPISVVAVNDAPVNTIAPSYNAIEDQALVLTGIQVSDVDALETNGVMTVTLEVLHGNLNIGTNPQVSISGNNSSVLTLSGTLNAINSLLATGVSYQGDLNYNGQDSLKMTTNDGGNSGGAALSTESIALIEVAAVNDAPVNTVPVLPIDASEDQALILTNIQVNDVDAAESNGLITVTFDVQHGSLSLLGNPAGVSVTNNNSSNLILVGTQAAINSALASGLSYQADADFHGTDSLTMTTNDNGNSGGPSLIDIDVAQIVIAPRADTPELTLFSQSMVAALGALIPLQIAADVINPVPNEVSVKIDGLGNAVIVDNEGNALGNSLGNGSWELSSDQLSNVYLQNLEEGEHTIVVTAVSDVNDGQPQESVPQNINVNVVDATQNDLEGGGTNDHIIGSELNDVLIGIFGDDLLEGKGGDDILIGGEGNDVLIGGRGNDTLTGGEGSDVFKWEAEDHGTLGLPEVDIVTDFNPQEDKLDLSNLLQGEHNGNYENYLHFEYDANGNYTTISISTNGGFNGSETAPAEVLSKSDQLIVVNGVDFVGAAATQADIINNLVALQQIVADA